MRLISLGGGVQSTALVVLAARGEIDFPIAIFANVGGRLGIRQDSHLHA